MDLVGIDPAKEALSFDPRWCSKIMGYFGIAIVALAAPAEIPTAPKVIVTAAVEGVHVVERPDEHACPWEWL